MVPPECRVVRSEESEAVHNAEDANQFGHENRHASEYGACGKILRVECLLGSVACRNQDLKVELIHDKQLTAKCRYCA